MGDTDWKLFVCYGQKKKKKARLGNEDVHFQVIVS